MLNEYNALLQNGTWELVPYHSHYKIMGLKSVFKVKYNLDGIVSRFKARLVAKGFYQTLGIYYFETYVPIVKSQTIRIVFSIAASNKWEIQQVDVNNAFLNEDLEEDVYMIQPKGFEDTTKTNYVCKLNKGLYGFKQAPKSQFEKLKTALLSWGFTKTKLDSSLFVREKEDDLTYVLAYVDDILVIGNNPKQVSHVIQNLDNHFAIKSLGPVHHFLKIEVTQDDSGINLYQERYVDDLLIRTGLQNSKPCNTPMSTSLKLRKAMDGLFEDAKLYWSTIGALQYLTPTRLDMAFIISKLSQFMERSSNTHSQTCKWVL